MSVLLLIFLLAVYVIQGMFCDTVSCLLMLYEFHLKWNEVCLDFEIIKTFYFFRKDC